MKGLGRRYAPDPRDQRCLMCDQLPKRLVRAGRPPRKTWRSWWTGDQGSTSECVGYSLHGLLRALPRVQRDPSPSEIYRQAQLLDEWPGENYLGTSVRGGAKALQADGKLVSYGWAFDLETVLNWLAFKGPVVLGTTWYDQMFRPDVHGVVRPGGTVAGGHAYLAQGYDETTKLLLCKNSWSRTWGINGRFYLHYEDAEELIQSEGEACTATE